MRQLRKLPVPNTLHIPRTRILARMTCTPLSDPAGKLVVYLQNRLPISILYKTYIAEVFPHSCVSVRILCKMAALPFCAIESSKNLLRTLQNYNHRMFSVARKFLLPQPNRYILAANVAITTLCRGLFFLERLFTKRSQNQQVF